MSKIILFVIIFFTFNLLAVEDIAITPSIIKYNAKSKIKDIDFLIKCGECCYPTSSYPCYLYYILCKLKSFQNNFFAYSNSTKEKINSFVVGRIKSIKKEIPLNGTFIMQNKYAYFYKKFYCDRKKTDKKCGNINIESEIDNNINELYKSYYLPNATLFKERLKLLNLMIIHISDNCDEYQDIRRSSQGVCLKRTKVENLDETLSMYNQALTSYNSGTIQIYNPNLLYNCIEQEKQIKKTSTTVFPVAPTIKRKSCNHTITAYCNNITTVNHGLKKPFSSNLTYIIIGIVGSIIIITIVILLFIKCCKQPINKKNNDKQKISQHKEKQYSIDDHIYEDPDCFNKNYNSGETIVNISNENENENENEIEKEQSSASSDIVISAKNLENNQLKIKMVDNDSFYKTMLINLPIDQHSETKVKIIKISKSEDDINKHIYNILEPQCNDNLTHKETSI